MDHPLPNSSEEILYLAVFIESGNKYSNFAKTLHAKAECHRLPFAPDFCAYNGPKDYNNTPKPNIKNVKYKQIFCAVLFKSNCLMYTFFVPNST